MSQGLGRGILYNWKLNRVRSLLVDSTITPIRVHHELVLQVFFSVDGEDLQGNPLEGDDSSGVMRMLVLTMPTVLPSVSTFSCQAECWARRLTATKLTTTVHVYV